MGTSQSRLARKRKKFLTEELHKIVSLLIRHYQPEKIVLFGSLVTGQVQEGSDIDLLLVKQSKKRPLERVMEVMALLGYPRVALDIFVYTPEEIAYLQREESPFIQNILEHGKVLYEKDY